jgi:hypothetical protein
MGLIAKKPGPTLRPQSAQVTRQLRQKRWPLTAQVPIWTEYWLQPGQRTAQAGQINCASPSLAVLPADTLSA